jgi:hypothetical protein
VADDDSFDVAAAGLRADGLDLETSLQVLASKLEAALPGRARVHRRGGGLLGRGPRRVSSIVVDLGESCYELDLHDGRVQGARERRVGGISIKREPLDADAWIAALTAELREQAQSSADARAALEKLLR